MPRDLFRHLSVRPPARSRFRRIVTLVTIVLHAVALSTVFIVQIFASVHCSSRTTPPSSPGAS